MNPEQTRQRLIHKFNAFVLANNIPSHYSLDPGEGLISAFGELQSVYEFLVRERQTEKRTVCRLNELLHEAFEQGDKQVHDAIDLGFIEHLGLQDPFDPAFCQTLLSNLPDCLKRLYEREMKRWHKG